MPMTVAYTNFGGQIIHENRGGTESFFTADPLGSVVDVRNSSGTQTFSATYWPYGEIRTSTGTNPSQFDFVGSLGYYRENSARTYVRARFLRKELARWMTVDPLWPDELAYGYAKLSPAIYFDFYGLQVHDRDDLKCTTGSDLIPDPCYNACHLENLDDLKDCLKSYKKCMKWFFWLPYMCQARYVTCLWRAKSDLELCGFCCNDYEDVWQSKCFDSDLPDAWQPYPPGLRMNRNFVEPI